MKKTILLASLLFIAVALCSCSNGSQETAQKAPAEKPIVIDPATLAAFAPLPAEFVSETNPITPEKIELGRMLYYDDRLSKNHDISCNTCHDLAEYGVDGLATSPGHNGADGVRNSPTVYNAAGHFVQFWDGREPDVEAQAKGPILNPIEMGMPDGDYVMKTVASIPGYVELFGKAFPDDADPLTYDNLAAAIGVFERKLVTVAKWDHFLKGNTMALSNAEKKGFNTFMSSGCLACHTGALLGGNMYQKLGLIKRWPDNKDAGRADVTKAETDSFFFKVPGLRDIAKTGPYTHDGSIDDLGKVVTMMGEYQLGQTIPAENVTSIVTFLNALTGQIPTDYIAEPELPESGPDTPAPDPS